MNHRFNVINQPLMLYLCRLIYSLLDFHRILINLSPQFRCHFNLYMSLSDIILEYQEHRFIGLKQYAVLVHVHILRGDCMLADVRGINDAETILG